MQMKARQLIDAAIERAKERGAYQLRAWSSSDKAEAISMWKALGFGLCPAAVYPNGLEVSGCFVTKRLVPTLNNSKYGSKLPDSKTR